MPCWGWYTTIHKNVFEVSCFCSWKPSILPVLPQVPHHVSMTPDKEFAKGGSRLATGHRVCLWGWGAGISFRLSQHWHHVSVTFLAQNPTIYCLLLFRFINVFKPDRKALQYLSILISGCTVCCIFKVFFILTKQYAHLSFSPDMYDIQDCCKNHPKLPMTQLSTE